MVEGVHVIGHVLRPDGRGHFVAVDRMTVWLFVATERPARYACRLAVDAAGFNARPAERNWSVRPCATGVTRGGNKRRDS